MLNIFKQVGMILLVTVVTVMPGMAYSTSYDFLNLIAASLGGGVGAIFLGLIVLAATRGRRPVPVVVTTAISGALMSVVFILSV